ncbi:unnamed protein product [Chondrus crispus]|uniref:HMA domain-containing protein n=1 Tax=Chondrus crispus TaxID=2769 RepID=R7QG46_CHOCR|nr:unnamed protein product [Chondrus crispus]CDF36753.1 unnamed protein product [Chondrus crispus]|eukprot:XP_005716572.1 unnamed protein product [Chondrus crispus]
MTCMNCVGKVAAALEALESATDVAVSLEDGRATLRFAGEDDALVRAVDLSPPVSPLRDVVLRIEGMTCMNCVGKVSVALEALESAADVAVSLEDGRATLRFAGEDDALVRAVAEGANKVDLSPPVSPLRDVVLRIEGMTCMNCVGKVSVALEALESAADVAVSLEDGRATLRFSGEDDALVRADVTRGYRKEHHDSLVESDASSANDVTTQLRVSGMTCSACVGSVETVLSKADGVSKAKVNLLAGRATVIHDASLTVAQELAALVAASGFQCQVLESTGNNDKSTAANVPKPTCGARDF